MLMRFDPFRELDTVAQMLAGRGSSGRPAMMPMDAYRQGDQFFVHFDLPGVEPSAVDLTIEKNVLTVRAERTWQPTEDQEVLILERPQGVFTRQIFLGESLDTEQVQATYDKGILTLRIPVAEQAKPRRVEIDSSGSERQEISTSAATVEASTTGGTTGATGQAPEENGGAENG